MDNCMNTEQIHKSQSWCERCRPNGSKEFSGPSSLCPSSLKHSQPELLTWELDGLPALFCAGSYKVSQQIATSFGTTNPDQGRNVLFPLPQPEVEIMKSLTCLQVSGSIWEEFWSDPSLKPGNINYILYDCLPSAMKKNYLFSHNTFPTGRHLVPPPCLHVRAPDPTSPLLCQEFLLQKLLHLLFDLSQAAVQSPAGALLLVRAGWRWELVFIFFHHLQHLLLFQGELLEEGQNLWASVNSNISAPFPAWHLTEFLHTYIQIPHSN